MVGFLSIHNANITVSHTFTIKHNGATVVKAVDHLSPTAVDSNPAGDFGGFFMWESYVTSVLLVAARACNNARMGNEVFLHQ